MNSVVSRKKSAARNKLSSVLESAQGQLAKYTEIAVNFVLERTGIAVEPDDSNCRDAIRRHMIVVAVCGRRVGYVEEVVGNYIKLTPLQAQGSSLIPLHWVDRVDSLIFLDRDYEEINRIRSLV